MSWIPIIPRSDASHELATAYDAVAGARGDVANILGIHSVHPRVMRAHLQLYRDLMFAPSPLTRVERELLAVTVSQANGCRY